MPVEGKFNCHCGNWRFRNAHFVIDEIREAVCRDLPFYGEIDGKEYCVLHYPQKTKAADFRRVFQERIENDNWDFRMVYFPELLQYENKEFQIAANFAHATFAEGLSLKYCKFYADFNFFDARFLEDALFLFSNFFRQVNFNSVEFQEYAGFSGINFNEGSHPSFNGTKFKISSFGSAEFHCEARFSHAVFRGRADFSQTEFFSKADFKNISILDNAKVDFRSATFYESSDFENVHFSEADFSRARFALSDELSSKTIFTNCKFDRSVSFVGATFHSQAYFSNATFRNAHFEDSTFTSMAEFHECSFLEDVFFNNTKFGYKDDHRIRSSQVVFDGTTFGEDSRVFFDNTWFSWHTSFDYVRFDGYVFFKGSKDNPVFDTVFEERAFWSLLKILNATFDKPEKVYFQTVRLRPSWFVNISSEIRNFNFTDIDWSNEHSTPITIEGELNVIEKLIKHNSKKLLAVVFRQLAQNAETNSRFDEASMFRRMAMETEWLEKKERVRVSVSNLVTESEKLKNRFTDIVLGQPLKQEDTPNSPKNAFDLLRRSDGFLIHWAYRITSYYGESWGWALAVFLMMVLLVFPLIYRQTYFQVCPKEKPVAMSMTVCESKDLEVKKNCECRKSGLGLGEAVVHSLTTATLQSVDYRKPASNKGETVVILEKVLAPLQAALLALALRRKFMR